MSKKTVTNGVDNFTVYFCDNGFTIEYSGRNDEDDWVSTKLIVPDLTSLHKEIEKAVGLK